MKKNISFLVLSALIATQICAAEVKDNPKPTKRFVQDPIAYIVDNPVQATIGVVVTLAIGLGTYLVFKQRAPAAANVAGPLAAVAQIAGHLDRGRPAPAPQARPDRRPAAPYLGSEQEMIAEAQRRSLAEIAPAQKLGMSPAEHSMNIDIFTAFHALQGNEARVGFLQELLYDMDHVFMEHDALLAFVLLVEGMQRAEMVAAFHSLHLGKWSLLTLAPHVGDIDPEAVPAPDFRALQADYQQIRRMVIGGADVVAVYTSLQQRRRHAVEDAILRLIIRRLYVPEGLSPQDVQRAEFALRNLFLETQIPQGPSAPPQEDPARVEEPLIGPAAASAVSAEPSAEEMRAARLRRLEKKET